MSRRPPSCRDDSTQALLAEFGDWCTRDLPTSARNWLDAVAVRGRAPALGKGLCSPPASLPDLFRALEEKALHTMVRAAAACLEAGRYHSALQHLEALPLGLCERPGEAFGVPDVVRGARTLEWSRNSPARCPYDEACWMLAEDAEAFSGVALALGNLSWTEKLGCRRGIAIVGAPEQVRLLLAELPRRFPEAQLERGLVRRPEDWSVSALSQQGRCWTKNPDRPRASWLAWPLRSA